jgi:exopolysaccharide production protein ExoQ
MLLVLAVCFGGGGSSAGLANLVVQLAALAALALNRRAFLEFFRQAPRILALLVAVTILLPLLQCIPLPPMIWHELPGRDLAVESLTLIGREQRWMPFSLNVRRTFIAFLSLIPPLAILILIWRASEADRRFLMTVLVGCGAVGVILGAQQLSFGNRELVLYAQTVGSQDLHGTFANRNTAGLFADVALCSLIGLLWRRHNSALRISAGIVVGVLLALGLFLTRSRSSMTLVIIPAAMLLMYLWNYRDTLFARRSQIIVSLLGLALLALSIGLLASNGRIQRSLARFDTMQDARPAIWQDTQSSIMRFWPVGSGIGTFDEVFQLDESLENLSPGRAGRAHNEYLETLVESGVLGPLLVGGWIVIIAEAIRRSIRQSSDYGFRLAASAVFVLLAFQSVLDYPLRSQTLLCVAGLAVGILIAKGPSDENVEAGMR